MWAIEDRGRMIVDHGLWRDTREAWGVHIYDEAVRRIPTVFLGESAYGTRRRVGVIHVPAHQFLRVERTIKKQFRHDPAYVLWLRRRCMEDLHHLHGACQVVEADVSEGRTAPDHVAVLFDLLVSCKAYMGFNWLVPKEEIGKLLGKVAGNGDAWGQEALLTLLAPDVWPHFTRLHCGLHLLAESLAAGAEPDYEWFAEHLGFAQAYPIRVLPLEQMDPLKAEVQSLVKQHGGDAARIRGEREAAVERMVASRQRRDAMVAGLLAAVPPSQAETRMDVLATAKLLVLSADEEEERHFAEMRAVRTLRRVAALVGLDIAQADEAELLRQLGILERCLPDLVATGCG